MTRILVVEDERQLRRALGVNLRARGYDVALAETGAEALQLAARHHPDLVILDLGLPDLDGSEVIEGLRGWTQVPIIVLSARHGEEAKVLALDAGADDYVTKPFGMDELLARLRATLRRAEASAAPAGDPVVTTPDFTVDLAAKRVLRGDTPVRLTPTEWHVLEVLVRADGRLVTVSSCCTRCGGRSTAPSSTTCASTSRSCAASSSRRRAPRATSSPSPGSATGSWRAERARAALCAASRQRALVRSSVPART